MTHVFTPAKTRLATAQLNLATAPTRMAICMSNTLADTAQDAATLAAIGTLDEYDGTGYARKIMAGMTVTQDDANNRAEYMVTSPIVWTTLGAGTRSAAGLLLYEHVDGTAANDKPIAWFDVSFSGNGMDAICTIDAEGLLWIGG